MEEASYIPLTEEALDDLKEYIKRCVSHAFISCGITFKCGLYFGNLCAD